MNGDRPTRSPRINAAGAKFLGEVPLQDRPGRRADLSQAEGDGSPARISEHDKRDLWNVIESATIRPGRCYVQVMPFAEGGGRRCDPFDLTKVWPYGDYPLDQGRAPGSATATRRTTSPQIEQAASSRPTWCRAWVRRRTRCCSAGCSPYPDTHRHRIGANYLQLPVNRPHTPVHSYNRDGAMRYDNPGDPVYAPNSYGGPKADPSFGELNWWVEAGEIVRSAYVKHREDDDFVQANAMVNRAMDGPARERLVSNVVGHASAGVTPEVQARVVEYWRNVDAEIGAQVAKGLGNGS